MAFSDDENVNIGSGALRRFSGDRYLLGGDVRFTQKKLLVAAEFISVDLDAANGIEYSPNGGHITGGYMFAENAQLLLRWDHFSSDDLFPDSDLIILGYNLWPTQVTELQVNYIINTDDAGFDHHQLLLNAQVEW
ncbi:MAG: hypothetical protein GWN00_24160 [Aliifodinibius sp.]|nr:hypothetical protein [Fodinibius sp.]NIW46774.1 hypothetical protein [Gammaproteobacteria bacterium]NIX57788.1 hypothetical protein [candidate division Zixibacteria bacterium]NIY27782.1 hypothetical protein [Fodinibius sp.]